MNPIYRPALWSPHKSHVEGQLGAGQREEPALEALALVQVGGWRRVREEGVHRQIPVGRESKVLPTRSPLPPPAGMMQPERRARRKNGFVSAAAHALTALRLTLGPQGLFDEVEQQSTAAFAGCSFLLCPPLKAHFLDAIFTLSPPQLLRKRGVGKIQSQGQPSGSFLWEHLWMSTVSGRNRTKSLLSPAFLKALCALEAGYCCIIKAPAGRPKAWIH